MKRILSALWICIVSFTLSACLSKNDEATALLNAVFNNEKTFITEKGDAVLLKDYAIGNGNFSKTLFAKPIEYVFVDFDDDKIDEMVINVSSDFGFYIVLHCNGLDVYGYEFGVRTLNQLKTDGSFIASGGAASSYYCKLSFEDNKANITYTAVKDNTMNQFELNGKECSIETLDEYINDWNLKEAVNWIKCKTATNTAPKDESNTIATLPKINLNNYISVRFRGNNSSGYASVTFDKEQFLLDHIKNISFNKDNEQVYRELYGNTDKSAANTLTRYISVSLDKYNKLSNGDTVKVIWEVNTEKIETYFELNYIYSSEQFLVSGLIVDSTVHSSQQAESEVENELENTTSETEETNNPPKEIVKYKIQYINNGGKHSNPETYSIEDEIELIAPQKTGYSFLGWTYQGQKTPVLNVRIQKGSTGNKKYTANWSANTYKITYDVNGGSISNNTQSVSYDDYYTLITPSRKGYTFAGWYDGKKAYQNGTWKTLNDVTLKAKWNINSYFVSINHSNEGSVNGEGSYAYNSDVTVSANSKLGYTWLGWYDKNDKCLSSKLSYSFNMDASNLSLYAKWKKSDDISDFSFFSTETTCTITGVLDDTKNTYRIPTYVTKIDNWAFFMCDYLTNITIPDSVTSIGAHAFSGCNKLTSISLPNSVTSIGKQAFSGCDSLKSIIIPKNVTRISEYLFNSCSNLTSVTIHDKVTFIGQSAFSGCTKLKNITFKGEISSWNNINIGNHWNFMVPATKVICSDGTVSLE